MATRTVGDNKHLAGLTSARYVRVTAAGSNLPIRTTSGRLLRVILNTNGATVTVKDGLSDIIGIIAIDAPEGSFNYGIFCTNGIYVDVSGAVDCTIVFSD